MIGALTALSTLINPSFIKGALYPFKIFSNYGYLLVENQSITFLEGLGITTNSHFTLFKLCALALILSFSFALLTRKYREKLFWTGLIIALTMGLLSFQAIRNFPLFGFFSLPIIVYNLKGISNKDSYYRKELYRLSEAKTKYLRMIFVPLSTIVILVCFYQGLTVIKNDEAVSGTGLLPEVNGSADFFKNNYLSGPVFNNYDIGGYLIYHLYPREKVFVDNRPEAYPAAFFNEIYKPMQQEENAWKTMDEKNNFNVIFFSHRDYTPWGQQFLISRVKDNDWAVVYYDPYAIILLKRNEKNSSLIKNYEIDKKMFVIN